MGKLDKDYIDEYEILPFPDSLYDSYNYLFRMINNNRKLLFAFEPGSKTLTVMDNNVSDITTEQLQEFVIDYANERSYIFNG